MINPWNIPLAFAHCLHWPIYFDFDARSKIKEWFFSVSHWLLLAFLGISVYSIVVWIRVGRTDVRTSRNNNIWTMSMYSRTQKYFWLKLFRFMWFMSWGSLGFRLVEWLLWWIYYLHLFCSNLLQFLASLLCIVDLAVSQTKQNIHDQRHPKSFVENLEKSDLEPVASERCKYIFSHSSCLIKSIIITFLLNCFIFVVSKNTVLDLGNLFNRYPSYQRPYYGGGVGGGYSPYYPQTIGGGGGGYYPQANGGGYYPGGTNMLGSGAGGYGGWGGNGGLNSYYGYNNNNNYQGHRNLGYGYYRGTNSYGFIPSQEGSFPTEGGGYRGYNWHDITENK